LTTVTVVSTPPRRLEPNFAGMTTAAATSPDEVIARAVFSSTARRA
jgi:hypothetical protein